MSSFNDLIDMFINGGRYVCVYTTGGHHRGKLISSNKDSLELEYIDKKERTIYVIIKIDTITAITHTGGK